MGRYHTRKLEPFSPLLCGISTAACNTEWEEIGEMQTAQAQAKAGRRIPSHFATLFITHTHIQLERTHPGSLLALVLGCPGLVAFFFPLIDF